MRVGGYEQGHRSRFPLVHAPTSHPTSSSKHWPWLRTLGGAAVICLAITAAATAASAA